MTPIRNPHPTATRRLHHLPGAAALACLVLFGCKKDEPPPAPAPAVPPPAPVKAEPPPSPPLAAAPVGLPEMTVPAATPVTAEKVQLGRMLFFDKRLSGKGDMACENCHQHEKGWTDGLALSTKASGDVNTRNSPSLYNVGFQSSWYWDGRATTLEAQVTAAWKGQMGGDPAKAAAALSAMPEYQARFENVFGAGGLTGENVAAALAAYLRTLTSGNAPWDRHEKGEAAAVADDAVKGWEIFRGKAHCALCHVPPLFTDTVFHNAGIGAKAEKPDPGRFKVSSDVKDTGAFKTPSLQSVTKTAPYFHDGSAATLEDAVKLMVGGGIKNDHLDEKLKPVKLSAKEMGQLLAFIRSLESDEKLDKPTLP